MVQARAMRHIYFSPHLDDAILCAGGLIHEQRQRGELVEIWTIMAGIPRRHAFSDLAREQHSLWGVSSGAQAMRLRREEDRAAAATLGARTRHMAFLDCIYRSDDSGRWLYMDIFAKPHSADRELTTAIRRQLSARLRADDKLYCTLGIGRHVDHVLVRRAVERLGWPVAFLADIPYALQSGKLERAGAETAGLSVEVLPVSDRALGAWVRAAAKYGSQIPQLFGSRAMLADALRKWVVFNGGLRLWRFQPPKSLGLARRREL